MRLLPALAKLTFAGFILALAIGLVAAFGTRAGFWGYDFGLWTLFPWCIGVGLATLVIGVAWILWAMIANDGSSARFGLIGLVGAAVVLANPIYEFASSHGEPAIIDVSTDTEHAPEFVSLLSQRDGATNSPDYDGRQRMNFDGKTSTVAILQHKYYSNIHTQGVLISPERLFKRAVAAAYGEGWDIVAIVPDAGRIEATDTTFFFGFTDDIVIRVKPAGMGAKLDIRSKARDGRRDMGRNIERVRSFLKRLATETN